MRKNQYKKTKSTAFPFKKIGKDDFVIGIDEAGRGSWAGPVVAAYVAWVGKCPIKNMLRDSKKMTANDREKTYEEICEIAGKGRLSYGVGIVENTVIDSVGIREANKRAMEQALIQFQNSKNKMQNHQIFLKIDGRDNYFFDIPDLPEPEYIVRGDDKIKQIMAASIIAKVTRDRLMIEYGSSYHGYGFEKHKGYGTALHQEAIKKIGICNIHRKSYEPIKLATSRKSL